ncbi:MAG: glutathione S-transferase family protein [Gammaproteobacteria bacterium]|nr:glutathione S-transferase family protein [Gammaproteobacteria bacterium]
MRGFPGHIDTCKCLYLGAEKGVQIDFNTLDLTGNEHQADAYLSLSPFGKIPCLGEGDTVISGAAAILPYIDIKGAGQSLTPRKAARLGEQNYWIEVGQHEVMPHINTIIDEQVLFQMKDKDYKPDQSKIDAALQAIDKVFDAADKQLEGKDYFASDYTFADVHWVAYMHFCEITGHHDLLNKRPNLKSWLERIKTRKNGTQITYNVLPDLEQIKNKELKHVA